MLKDFKTELKNLSYSENFFNWMYELEGRPEDKSQVENIVKNIKYYGLNGYCEDVALYFYLNFEDVKLIETYYHFAFEYQNKYYDAFNVDGVDKLDKLEYFHQHPEHLDNLLLDMKSYPYQEGTPHPYHCPKYYKEAALKLKFPYASCLRPPRN